MEQYGSIWRVGGDGQLDRRVDEVPHRIHGFYSRVNSVTAFPDSLHTPLDLVYLRAFCRVDRATRNEDVAPADHKHPHAGPRPATHPYRRRATVTTAFSPATFYNPARQPSDLHDTPGQGRRYAHTHSAVRMFRVVIISFASAFTSYLTHVNITNKK